MYCACFYSLSMCVCVCLLHHNDIEVFTIVGHLFSNLHRPLVCPPAFRTTAGLKWAIRGNFCSLLSDVLSLFLVHAPYFITFAWLIFFPCSLLRFPLSYSFVVCCWCCCSRLECWCYCGCYSICAVLQLLLLLFTICCYLTKHSHSYSGYPQSCHTKWGYCT